MRPRVCTWYALGVPLKNQNLKRMNVVLSLDLVNEVRSAAKEETDRNFSLMLRRLVREAFRQRKETSCPT